jgi:hypothetical protein
MMFYEQTVDFTNLKFYTDAAVMDFVLLGRLSSISLYSLNGG